MGAEVAQLEAAVAALSHDASTPSAAPAGPTRCCCRSRRSTSSRATRSSPPPFTFFATAGAIHNAGGTPVFVDIDPDTLQHLARGDRGGDHARGPGPSSRCTCSARWPRWSACCRWPPRHGLAVIEDAAQSIGARRKIDGDWRMAGELGTVGTLSFFPSKNLGGLRRRRDDGHAGRRAGRPAPRASGCTAGRKQYFHDEVGSNSRLDTLQAAVLLAKLPHLAAWSAARARDTRRATPRRSRAIPTICPPRTDPANEHIFNQYTIRVPAARRAAGAPQGAAASARRSTTRSRCTCSPASPTSATPRAACRHPSRRREQVISLPVYPELTEAQQDAVIEAVLEFYADASRMHVAQDADRARPSGARRCSASSGWATSGCRWRSSWPTRATGCSASTCSRRWSTGSTRATRTSRT